MDAQASRFFGQQPAASLKPQIHNSKFKIQN